MKKFYKYCKIDQNLYNSLINNELYFSNPRAFNDPFDSSPRLKITNDKNLAINLFNLLKAYINDIKDYIQHPHSFVQQYDSFKRFLSYITSEKPENIFKLYETESLGFEERLTEIFSFYNFEGIYDLLSSIDLIGLQNKMFQDFIFFMIDFKKKGVACGSNIPNCPVMWGHYADNHKGVCLEFQLSDNHGKDLFCFTQEDSIEIANVVYTDYPIDILNMQLEQVAKIELDLFITKSKRWEYENEVRLISKNQGLMKFKRSSLLSVIFGCRTTKKDRYSLCNLLARFGYKSPYSLSHMQPDKYEMKIDQMIFNDVAGAGFHFEELNLDILRKRNVDLK